MEYLYLMFILCIGPSLQQYEVGTNISLSIYYTSMSYSSIQFITTQLYPTYIKLHKYMTLDFVPYGFTTMNYTQNGSQYFSCIGGLADCYGNQVQGCALQQNINDFYKTQFIYCYMNSLSFYNFSLCAEEAKLNTDEIEKCLHENNSSITEHYRQRTITEVPNLIHLPGLQFNQKYTVVYDMTARRNLFNLTCKFLQNPPECYSITRRKRQDDSSKSTGDEEIDKEDKDNVEDGDEIGKDDEYTTEVGKSDEDADEVSKDDETPDNDETDKNSDKTDTNTDETDTNTEETDKEGTEAYDSDKTDKDETSEDTNESDKNNDKTNDDNKTVNEETSEDSSETDTNNDRANKDNREINESNESNDKTEYMDMDSDTIDNSKISEDSIVTEKNIDKTRKGIEETYKSNKYTGKTDKQETVEDINETDKTNNGNAATNESDKDTDRTYNEGSNGTYIDSDAIDTDMNNDKTDKDETIEGSSETDKNNDNANKDETSEASIETDTNNDDANKDYRETNENNKDNEKTDENNKGNEKTDKDETSEDSNETNKNTDKTNEDNVEADESNKDADKTDEDTNSENINETDKNNNQTNKDNKENNKDKTEYMDMDSDVGETDNEPTADNENTQIESTCMEEMLKLLKKTCDFEETVSKRHKHIRPPAARRLNLDNSNKEEITTTEEDDDYKDDREEDEAYENDKEDYDEEYGKKKKNTDDKTQEKNVSSYEKEEGQIENNTDETETSVTINDKDNTEIEEQETTKEYSLFITEPMRKAANADYQIKDETQQNLLTEQLNYAHIPEGESNTYTNKIDYYKDYDFETQGRVATDKIINYNNEHALDFGPTDETNTEIIHDDNEDLPETEEIVDFKNEPHETADPEIGSNIKYGNNQETEEDRLLHVIEMLRNNFAGRRRGLLQLQDEETEEEVITKKISEEKTIAYYGNEDFTFVPDLEHIDDHKSEEEVLSILRKHAETIKNSGNADGSHNFSTGQSALYKLNENETEQEVIRIMRKPLGIPDNNENGNGPIFIPERQTVSDQVEVRKEAPKQQANPANNGYDDYIFDDYYDYVQHITVTTEAPKYNDISNYPAIRFSLPVKEEVIIETTTDAETAAKNIVDPENRYGLRQIDESKKEPIAQAGTAANNEADPTNRIGLQQFDGTQKEVIAEGTTDADIAAKNVVDPENRYGLQQRKKEDTAQAGIATNNAADPTNRIGLQQFDGTQKEVAAEGTKVAEIPANNENAGYLPNNPVQQTGIAGNNEADPENRYGLQQTDERKKEDTAQAGIATNNEADPTNRIGLQQFDGTQKEVIADGTKGAEIPANNGNEGYLFNIPIQQTGTAAKNVVDPENQYGLQQIDERKEEAIAQAEIETNNEADLANRIGLQQLDKTQKEVIAEETKIAEIPANNGNADYPPNIPAQQIGIAGNNQADPENRYGLQQIDERKKEATAQAEIATNNEANPVNRVGLQQFDETQKEVIVGGTKESGIAGNNAADPENRYGLQQIDERKKEPIAQAEITTNNEADPTNRIGLQQLDKTQKEVIAEETKIAEIPGNNGNADYLPTIPAQQIGIAGNNQADPENRYGLQQIDEMKKEDTAQVGIATNNEANPVNRVGLQQFDETQKEVIVGGTKESGIAGNNAADPENRYGLQQIDEREKEATAQAGIATNNEANPVNRIGLQQFDEIPKEVIVGGTKESGITGNNAADPANLFGLQQIDERKKQAIAEVGTTTNNEANPVNRIGLQQFDETQKEVIAEATKEAEIPVNNGNGGYLPNIPVQQTSLYQTETKTEDLTSVPEKQIVSDQSAEHKSNEAEIDSNSVNGDSLNNMEARQPGLNPINDHETDAEISTQNPVKRKTLDESEGQTVVEEMIKEAIKRERIADMSRYEDDVTKIPLTRIGLEDEEEEDDEGSEDDETEEGEEISVDNDHETEEEVITQATYKEDHVGDTGITANTENKDNPSYIPLTLANVDQSQKEEGIRANYGNEDTVNNGAVKRETDDLNNYNIERKSAGTTNDNEDTNDAVNSEAYNENKDNLSKVPLRLVNLDKSLEEEGIKVNYENEGAVNNGAVKVVTDDFNNYDVKLKAGSTTNVNENTNGAVHFEEMTK